MFAIFHQIAVKTISVIAGFLTLIGIIKTPILYYNGQNTATDYQIAEKQEQKTEKEILTIKGEEKAQKETSRKNNDADKSDAAKIMPQKPSPLITENINDRKQQTSNNNQNAIPLLLSISLEELNSEVRKSVVNIICISKAGGYLRPITASGVTVNPQGIILTNAHIAQYFLLENYPFQGSVDCVIRNGDIAQPAYDAELVYISPAWIEKNSNNIIQQDPEGTGENDYAFLRITKSVMAKQNIPPFFPSIEPNFGFNDLPSSLPLLLVGYPAGFLGGMAIQKDLGMASAFASLESLYTFSEKNPTTLDLFSIKGNVVAQSGSSGGAVIDARDGKLIGIITTSTSAATTANRTLNAITLSHIARSFENSAGKNLSSFLGRPNLFSVIFPESEFNRLKNLLIQQLEKM